MTWSRLILLCTTLLALAPAPGRASAGAGALAKRHVGVIEQWAGQSAGVLSCARLGEYREKSSEAVRRRVGYPSFGKEVSEESVRYLRANHQGSVIAAVGGDGSLVGSARYTEWGERRVTGEMPRFGYTGQIWLPSARGWHYKARLYRPTLGRFLQTDPVGYADQMNLYAYVQNDPVGFVDPSGESATVAGAIGGCAVTGLACPLGAAAGAAGGVIVDTAIVVGAVGGTIGAVALLDWIWNSVTGDDEAAADAPDATRAGDRRHTPEHEALVDMAQTDKKSGGISKEDMEAYKDLNKEAGDRGFTDKGAVRGPEAHPPRTPNSKPGPGQQPHGHVGPVNHIPIRDLP